MKFKIIIDTDPDLVISSYQENTGIPTEQIGLTLEEIISEELMGWLISSGIEVIDIQELNEH
jgi:hypothetical protein